MNGAKIPLQAKDHIPHEREKGQRMNNNPKAKVQNRITLVTIALLVCVAAVLIVMTSVQDRRTDSPERKNVDSTADTNDAQTTVTTPEMRGDDPKKVDSVQETEASVPEEVTPVISDQTDDVLPHFISPVNGNVSQTYSVDVPVYSITMEDYRTHAGIDIVATEGSAVRAAADGVIEEIWEDPMMGTCLSLRHSGGAKSIYKNLSPNLPGRAVPGAEVKSGEVIGAVGDSALCEIAQESHVHYELTIDGVSVNPQDYILLGTQDLSYEE